MAKIPAGRRPVVKIVGKRASAFDDLIKQIAILNLDNDVSFMGRMGTEEIRALYQNAVASVYVSLYEGFGLPVLEAMASGCPVIASDVSSIPEVAGDSAILVQPTDADALAEAIQRVMETPSLASAMRERGIARAAAYTWERAARRTIEAFAAALG